MKRSQESYGMKLRTIGGIFFALLPPSGGEAQQPVTQLSSIVLKHASERTLCNGKWREMASPQHLGDLEYISIC